MTYYIFRHGQTFESKHKILYGENVEKAEILLEGIPTVKKIGEFIKEKNVDAFFASPYLRCRQTVSIISEIIGKEFQFDDKLGEFRREREGIPDFINRVKNFLELKIDSSIKSIAICTHGYVVSALRELIINGHVQEERLNDYPETGVIVKIENKIATIMDFNKV